MSGRPMPRRNTRRAQRGAFVPLEIPPLSQIVQRLGRDRGGVPGMPAGPSASGDGPTRGGRVAACRARLDRTMGGTVPEEGQ